MGMRRKVCAIAFFAAALPCLAEFKMDRSAMSDEYWALWNDEVQARIDADIEANRKTNGVFTVEAQNGVEVTVEQLSHEFRFGAHIFNYNQLGNKDWNDAYKASYGDGGIFNQATVAFYWNDYEPVPNRQRAGGDYEDTERFWNSLSREEAMEHPFWRRPAPGPVIDFLKSKDMFIHGHVLIWGSSIPEWLYSWYCPESEKCEFDALGVPRLSCKNIPEGWTYNRYWRKCWQKVFELEDITQSDAQVPAVARRLAEMAPTFTREMRRIFRKRVFDVAGAFGGVVDSWDVVNESQVDCHTYTRSRTDFPVWKSYYGLMPGDYPLHALLDAKEAFPPETRLAINDYHVHPAYPVQVKDLLAEGAKIDIVGCQMHIFDTNDCMRLALGATNVNWVGSPDIIRGNLDMMATTGRPLHISEVTICAPGADARSRMIQAILARNIYRAWFSHPKTMGITWWNTVDGCGFKGEPLVSGLFTADMKRKPAYDALDDLVNREWRTKTTAKVDYGRISFRGFRGRYRLSWKSPDGKALSKTVYLK